MSFPVKTVRSVILMLVVSIHWSVFAEESTTEAVKVKEAVDDGAVARNETEVKSTTDEGKDTQENAEAKTKPAKKKKRDRVNPARPVGLEALLAGPLQAIFGGAAVVGAAGEAPMMAVEQEAPAEVANDDPMVAQFLNQFQPKLFAELAFVRLICSDLTPEQRPKIKRAAHAGLMQAAKRMANLQNRIQVGMATNQSQDPSKMIREAISKALEETLSVEQMARFADEATHRRADRKRATIQSVVARLDNQLFLVAKQREEIEAAISSRWQEDWEKWLTTGVHGAQYFPVIPDECVTPHLNSDQKSIWNSLQKIDVWWWGGNGGHDQADDGWWGPVEADNNPVINGGAVQIQVGF